MINQGPCDNILVYNASQKDQSNLDESILAKSEATLQNILYSQFSGVHDVGAKTAKKVSPLTKCYTYIKANFEKPCLK